MAIFPATTETDFPGNTVKPCPGTMSPFESRVLVPVIETPAGVELRNPNALTGAEVSGLNLTTLAEFAGLRISDDQMFRLLDAMGVSVRVRDR